MPHIKILQKIPDKVILYMPDLSLKIYGILDYKKDVKIIFYSSMQIVQFSKMSTNVEICYTRQNKRTRCMYRNVKLIRP